MLVAGPVLSLPFPDIDTDQIIPASYLTGISPDGLGPFLFEGRTELLERLNRAPGAKFIVAAENFGCGSSREHAVWAIRERGFQAVIAPSFARIFLENAYNNGLAPIALAPQDVLRCAEAPHLQLDLATRTLTLPDGDPIAFALDPVRELFLRSGGYLAYVHSQIPSVRARQAALALPFL